MKNRIEALATTLETGAEALASLASAMTPAEWDTRLPRDGRKIGVVVHHVASLYPLEIELAQKLAAGGALSGVTWDDVHEMNARHAREHDGVSPDQAIALLRKNAAAAAGAIRALTEGELDEVAPNSLYGGAPLTCQFMLEDHAVRHSFHHAERIRAALGR
jgi:hypothetical protein